MRTLVLVLDSGEEAFAAIAAFAAKTQIHGAAFTAIGAFSGATVGWFDFARKAYDQIEVAEQCEVLSLIGDIAEDDAGRPSIHAHAVLGLKDGTTRGGHFLRGLVHPTLEITLTEAPQHLHRRKVPELGIALIRP
jgi:predicted DNA-binding protein with PD1-like motif